MCEANTRQATIVEALKGAYNITSVEIQSATTMIKNRGVIETGIEYGTPVVNKTNELINEKITEPYLKDNQHYEHVKKVIMENGAVEGSKKLVEEGIEFTTQSAKQASEQVVQTLNEKKEATVLAVTTRVEETKVVALEKKEALQQKSAQIYTETKEAVTERITPVVEALNENRQTATGKLQELYENYAATYVNLVLELATSYNTLIKERVEQTAEYFTAKWSELSTQKDDLVEELNFKKEAMIELAQNKTKFVNEFATEQKQEITATVQSVLTATEQVNAMVKEQGVMATARVGYNKASEISQPYVQKAQDYIKVTPLTQAAA